VFAADQGEAETSQWINPNEVHVHHAVQKQFLSADNAAVTCKCSMMESTFFGLCVHNYQKLPISQNYHTTSIQTLFTTDENMLLLSKVLKGFRVQQNQSIGSELELDYNVTTVDFLRVLTTPSVVDAIAEVLTKRS
jgi:hypothetical protein